MSNNLLIINKKTLFCLFISFIIIANSSNLPISDEESKEMYIN